MTLLSKPIPDSTYELVAIIKVKCALFVPATVLSLALITPNFPFGPSREIDGDFVKK